MVPIIIISFNNCKYVKNTISQIKKINESYYNNITILDNCSSDTETLEFLQSTDVKIIRNPTNSGPQVSLHNNSDIYNTLPNQFILTDPDLQFNENLPSNFIDQMVELSNLYNCTKIGFALDISEPDKLYADKSYSENNSKNIVEWEKPAWNKRIPNENYELYEAAIDTTFCLVNKNSRLDYEIRMAGNFLAKHLPWYIENPLLNIYENYILNKLQTRISTTSKLILKYINQHFLNIQKNNIVFFIRKNPNDQNLGFWTHAFSNWENETFRIFDMFLQKDKIFIDIGGWIGTTSIYSSKKSKEVYVVEADKNSFVDLVSNCEINSRNITCINKAIFNEDNIDVSFGKNKFLSNSKLNDSTSQIYQSTTSDGCYRVKTITIQSLIQTYNINYNEISLIKVDIEGGEEYILDDLFSFHTKTKVPMFISFHYSWWNNKNLDRFSFLTNTQKNTIRNHPFTSLLITST
jgi:FkbM family methyltransferase